MAFVHGRFYETGSDDYELVAQMPESGRNFLVAHDFGTGDLVAAVCKGDHKGTDVYKFERLERDRSKAIEMLRLLAIPENVHVTLLPWVESERFPMTLDSGDAGDITFFHRPFISVHAVPSEYDFPG